MPRSIVYPSRPGRFSSIHARACGVHGNTPGTSEGAPEGAEEGKQQHESGDMGASPSPDARCEASLATHAILPHTGRTGEEKFRVIKQFRFC